MGEERRPWLSLICAIFIAFIYLCIYLGGGGGSVCVCVCVYVGAGVCCSPGITLAIIARAPSTMILNSASLSFLEHAKRAGLAGQ